MHKALEHSLYALCWLIFPALLCYAIEAPVQGWMFVETIAGGMTWYCLQCAFEEL